ncbi:hypothetical protein AAE478_008331 [Parahypoxylon ruwenzoriense]
MRSLRLAYAYKTCAPYLTRGISAGWLHCDTSSIYTRFFSVFGLQGVLLNIPIIASNAVSPLPQPAVEVLVDTLKTGSLLEGTLTRAPVASGTRVSTSNDVQ